MKKMLILIASAITALNGTAQKPSDSGDLNRQMDVTRDYEPTVGRADKLSVKPNMTDTVQLRPELHYEITPSPVNYGFDVTPIRPVTVNTNDLSQQIPVYIKAGLGVPFQSLLDAAVSSTMNREGNWGILLNHYGSWSDRKNMNDLKTPAVQTFNKIKVFGQHNWGRFALGGEAGFDYDRVSRYGYDTSMVAAPALHPLDASASALRQNFSTVHGKVFFGHSFEDLSRFNFRMSVGGYYTKDYYNDKEAGIETAMDMGKRFGGKHEALLHIDYDYHKGGGLLSGHKDNIVNVAPRYRLQGDKITFMLGVNYTFNSEQSHNEGALFPLFELTWRAAEAFTPYVTLNGEFTDHCLRSTLQLNPYVMQGQTGRNTAEYNGRIGIKGSASSSFSYHVFGGLTRYRNLNYYQNLYAATTGAYLFQGNVFMINSRDVTMWTLGGELEGRVSGRFGIELNVQFRGYNVKKVDGLGADLGLPKLTSRLALKYNHRDKLLLKAGVEMLGARDYEIINMLTSTPTITSRHINMQPDVFLTGEYNFTKRFGIFVEGHNLANQKIFTYSQYRSLGVNVLAGVKLQF